MGDNFVLWPTVLLKWPLTAELLPLSRSVAGEAGWHILHRDEGNIHYGRWFWNEKLEGKRLIKIIISNRVKLILYLVMSWRRVAFPSFSWSTKLFSSGWKEFTQLSGYYYNFKGLIFFKFSHCALTTLFMIYTVQAGKFAFRAYKIFDICVNILCILSLENECSRNINNWF